MVEMSRELVEQLSAWGIPVQVMVEKYGNEYELITRDSFAGLMPIEPGIYATPEQLRERASRLLTLANEREQEPLVEGIAELRRLSGRTTVAEEIVRNIDGPSVTPRVMECKHPLAQMECAGHGRLTYYNLAIGYCRHADDDSECDRLTQ